MAQPTAQKLVSTNCLETDDGNPNNSANTDIHAYSETTFGDLWVLSFLRKCE